MGLSDRLLELATSYHREARKCAKGRAYLAAVVMQVATLEAALQAMCTIYLNDVKKTIVYQRKKFRGKRYRALEFSLYQLITIAAELSWFPSKHITWAGKRTDLAGFTHEIRKVRNLVHPGAWARERKDPTKFTKGIYEAVYEVFEVASSWLQRRVEQDLRKRMGAKVCYERMRLQKVEVL
jgi:hypothetical protein